MPKQTECRRTSGSHFTQIKNHSFISSRFALEMYFFINHIAELFRLKTLAGNFDHERNLKYKRLPDSELLDLRSELYGSETHEYSFAHFRLPWKFLLPKCWVAIFKLRTKIIYAFLLLSKNVLSENHAMWSIMKKPKNSRHPHNH